MLDLYFVVVIVTFFGATLALVWLCQTLSGGNP